MPSIPDPKPLDEITQDDFEAYEAVRQLGNWNMFAPQAREASGLDLATYRGVMRHYGALKDKYPGVRQ